MIDTLLGLIAVVALVALSSFFVAAEFALVAADRTRMQRDAAAGKRAAKTAVAVAHRLAYYLSGIQLGITAASLALGVIASPAIARAVEGPLESAFGADRAHGIALAVGFVFATVGTTLVGELIPKNVAIGRPVGLAYLLVGPLRVYTVIFGPVIRAISGAAHWTVAKVGIEPQEELASVRSLEEIELLIRSSGEEGVLDPDAFGLLTRTLRFENKTAADALVPRVSMEVVTADDTIADLLAASFRTGFSRFPVVRESLDDVAGVVHVKDALRIAATERAASLVSAVMTDAMFVPESRDLPSLLADLRQNGTHMAVVLDEFGGTAGLITLEDVLEEIVGEIADEYDPVEPSVPAHLPEGTYLLPGTSHPDEVYDATTLELPEGDYETLAGFVLDQLGRIPKPGDWFEFEGWHVVVDTMDRLRIDTIRLVAPARAADPGS